MHIRTICMLMQYSAVCQHVCCLMYVCIHVRVHMFVYRVCGRTLIHGMVTVLSRGRDTYVHMYLCVACET